MLVCRGTSASQSGTLVGEAVVWVGQTAGMTGYATRSPILTVPIVGLRETC